MTPNPSKSPEPPSGPRYSARVALNCLRGHAPGPVLHASQELRAVIDDQLRQRVGRSYEHHRTQSVGEDKLTVIFIFRAGTPAEAVRTAGLAASTLVEILAAAETPLDLSGVALVVRAG